MQKRIIFTTLLVETSPQGLPLGAACIASAVKNDVRTKERFSVALVDFSLEDADIVRAQKAGGDDAAADAIAQKLAARSPDYLCCSVYVWNHTLLEAVARKIKRLLPDCVCIAGGPEVTANPTGFAQFDYMIAGQGERAMVELLCALEEKQKIGNCAGRAFNVQGVYAQKDALTAQSAQMGEILRTCPLPPDVTVSPYLDGTIDPSKYGGALWELARGCPFKCSYCYESKGEQKIAYFPLARLEKEIELFAKKNIAQVFVLDPTYNANKQRAVAMIRTIAKKALGMFFYFEARAEFIDRELARAFATIPCALQIGLQSADERVLKNVHRTLDKKVFTRNIGYLNEAGVTFGFDLIFGLPGDTYAGFCRSIDFALGLYPNNLELFCLSVLPGTTLYDDAAGFGLEWERVPPYHVLRTPQFSAQDLARAETLSRAVNLFYNDGRAVPWFNTVLFPLRQKPSAFFEAFATWHRRQGKGDNDQNIDRIQLDFVRAQYKARHLEKLLLVAEDVITMNNALSRCTATGAESHITLRYHPDDIMSEYATDIAFFAQHCGKQSCRVHVFSGKNGVDWRVE